jgi:hypothetical protein
VLEVFMLVGVLFLIGLFLMKPKKPKEEKRWGTQIRDFPSNKSGGGRMIGSTWECGSGCG